MTYTKGMMATCRKTGRRYDPYVELIKLLEEHRNMFIRMKER